jgi:hypothetical protein
MISRCVVCTCPAGLFKICPEPEAVLGKPVLAASGPAGPDWLAKGDFSLINSVQA